jgi:dihydroneopterin aldolase
MLEIILKEMEFFAFHGLYPEENKLGSKFTANLKVTVYDESTFLDYVLLYQLIESEMQNITPTLEKLAQKICDQIKMQFEGVSAITIEVQKHQPPLGGLCKYAAVRLTRNYYPPNIKE